jgi:CTP synthase (UTP-ammonia lyase)
MAIEIAPGSLTQTIYRRVRVEEEFNCNYELNPEYEYLFEKGRLRIAGRGQSKEVRIVELADHPFFLATAFQPQLSSQSGKPHPLISAFLRCSGKNEQRRTEDHSVPSKNGLH